MVSNLKATILIRRNSKLCLDELDISPEKIFLKKFKFWFPLQQLITLTKKCGFETPILQIIIC